MNLQKPLSTTTTLLLASLRLSNCCTTGFVVPRRHRGLIRTTTTTTTKKQRSSPSRDLSSSASCSSTQLAMSASSSSVHRVLCYGDSLTAGTTDLPFEMYPYAPHLERALNNISSDAQSADSSYVVRHRGMPGWTAEAMIEAADDPRYGLKSAIESIQNPALSCVIIMAGTNDLGYSVAYPEDQRVNKILDPIKALHQMAWENGIPKTVAIALPPSGYQSQVQQAATLATEVNSKLQQFCESNGKTATFVQFPFQYERGGDNWSSDGLHFSPQGYQTLGEYLANPLEKVLKQLDTDDDAHQNNDENKQQQS